MARNIGATLSLKNGNFFTGLKSAAAQADIFKGKLTGVTGALKNHSSQLSASDSGLKSLAGRVAGVVSVYAGIRQITSFTQECVNAANAQTAAEKRLQQTMSNVKGTTQTQIDGIKAYASALQGLTTVGDEVAIYGASQLATFQLQGDTIKTLMPALEDLTVAQYGVSVSSNQMQGMANLVGKVMSGSVSALTRYGVVMNASQKNILKTGSESQKAAVLVDVLKQNFGGLAEAMANTPEGRIQQLKNAWGDMQEVIGAKLYPVITKTLTWTAQKVPSVQNVIISAVNACQPVFTAFTDSILPSANNLFGAIKNIGSAIIDSFGESATGGISTLTDSVIPGLINILSVSGNATAFVVKHWKAFTPIVAGVVTVVGLYKAAVIACNAVEGVRSGLMTANALIMGTSKATLEGMTIAQLAHTAALGIAETATTALGAAQSFLNAAFIASPIGWIVVGIGALVAAFAVLWNKCEGFRNFWKGMWNGIKNVASTAWNGIKNVCGNVMSAVKETVSEKLGNIKTAYEEHGGGIKGVTFAAIEGVKGYYTAGFTFLDNVTGGKLSAITSKIGEKLAPIKEKFSSAWNSAKNVTGNIFGGIKNICGSTMDAAKNTVSEKLGNIKTAYEEHGGGIKGVAFAAIEGVKGYYTAGFTFLDNVTGGKLSAMKETFSSKFEGIKNSVLEKWQAVKDGTVNIWEGIVSGVKGCINKVIEGINGMIGRAVDGINGLINGVNSITGAVGIPSIPTISAPQIPMLAKGGTVTNPGSVIVGERGPEILNLPKAASVVPLNNSSRTVVNTKNGGNTVNIELNLNINADNRSIDELTDDIINTFVPKLKIAMANL